MFGKDFSYNRAVFHFIQCLLRQMWDSWIVCDFLWHQVILSCDEKESHAGDLGNIATPILGETSIDLVDRILTLGDGGVRSVLIN